MSRVLDHSGRHLACRSATGLSDVQLAAKPQPPVTSKDTAVLKYEYIVSSFLCLTVYNISTCAMGIRSNQRLGRV